MANLTSKQLSANLSKRLANYKLSDAVINRIADRALIKGLELGNLGPCPIGICCDYFTPKPPKPELFKQVIGLKKWEVFPYGIIAWDRFHVRVALEVPEIQNQLNAVVQR